MLDHKTVKAALGGDDKRLRREAGPNSVFCVAPELSCVFLVQDEDGKQTGIIGGAASGRVELPRSFRVQEITHDGEQFVLTAADGRTARGTPEQFTAWHKILDESVNPRYDEQLAEILANTHLLPVREIAGLDAPKTGPDLADPEIVRLGEAWVTMGEREVWLTFDLAWPEKVTSLLPHTRDLLARLDQLGRVGAEFLWSQGSAGEDMEPEYLELMTATSLAVYLTGDFEIHYEGASDSEYYMDGYWPSVQFRADGTPVDHAIEA